MGYAEFTKFSTLLVSDGYHDRPNRNEILER